MIAAIKEARDAGNSLGGVVKCVVRGCPPGLGDPVFDKLDATLAHAHDEHSCHQGLCRGLRL